MEELEEFIRYNEKMNSSVLTDWSREMILQAMQIWAEKQCAINGVVYWLPFIPENYERFGEIASKNKLLKKFDDGSVVKMGDKEPLAICTHFAEEI